MEVSAATYRYHEHLRRGKGATGDNNFFASLNNKELAREMVSELHASRLVRAIVACLEDEFFNDGIVENIQVRPILGLLIVTVER